MAQQMNTYRIVHEAIRLFIDKNEVGATKIWENLFYTCRSV